MSSDQYSKNKQYRITRYIHKDDASYMYSDTTWYWDVEDLKTKKIIYNFVESEYGDSSGWRSSGTEHVRFSDDNQFVIAENYDGSITVVALATGKENKFGASQVIVGPDGKFKILKYDFDKMKLKYPGKMLWKVVDIEKGTSVCSFTAQHDGAGTVSVEFSPDGKSVLAKDDKGNVTKTAL